MKALADAMSDDVNVKIYSAECTWLGGPTHWDWRQRSVSVPYWRVYWNSIGGACIDVNGVEMELAPDKVLVVAPRTIYSSRAEREVRHFYVHFSAANPFPLVKPQVFELRKASLLELASSLAEEASTAECGSWRFMFKVSIYVHSILLALPPDAIPSISEYDPRITAALRILDQGKAFNKDIAARVHMSRNGFLQLFRREVGISPQRFSLRERLNDACVLLHFSDRSIEDIAAETGFHDRYHFGKAFKNETGISPAKYRKQRMSLKRASPPPAVCL